ncbi:DUF2339 domain-containing protein [Chryseobacterium sp. MMS23-Vi53]|uniref:DUF2339 domain-containing protein n=1 Tax=Chryseobacterium sp. MMS23-Vi53 TaxID=3386644 RepID=UPI0039EB02C1
MDNYSFFFLSIIIIIAVYNYLNSKIKRLEKEISELRKKPVTQHENLDIPKPIADSTEIKEEIKISSQPEIHEEIPAEKNWTTPIFDFLKQNALTIIGIFTLVLGIGYFVKYAIDRNWIGETSRVGIGFLVGAGIIAVGHFLRKNYSAFSSIITGGGVAVLYFTTTIAFREYHLFSQTTAFSITCLITLISIALSYYYKSEILIIFSLFGGFLAPLMISTGQSNYPFLFTYLTVLNIGMLVVVFLKNWRSVGWIAFIFTILYLFYWTSEQTEINSIYFYIISYIIFYAFALLDYFKNDIISKYNILMLILINFSSIIGLVYIFNTLQYKPIIIFPLVFATVNGIIFYKEFSKRHHGINYSVFAALTVSLITIAIALQFETHLITSVWAVEATLLLFIWKKTNQNIFKICFYILFPLVIIAQIITWGQYAYVQNLKIVFNPVFLTSSVTVITTFANLILLRKLSDNESETNFFEDLFTILSYGVIYVALLLEIIYHISEKPLVTITCIAILYTITFIFGLLIFRKKLEINNFFELGIVYIFLILIVYHTSFTGSVLVDNILEKINKESFYGIYLMYLIPLIIIGYNILPKTDFYKSNYGYWAICGTIVITVSFEIYRLYILGNTPTLSESYQVQKHFSILYLPIIWTVLASIFIYLGLKNNISELNKIGFALIGIMILKLYSYDVWQMDNVSRIIAFIILGIILLLSSFLFQRLKKIIKNLVDSKQENKEHENIESQ